MLGHFFAVASQIEDGTLAMQRTWQQEMCFWTTKTLHRFHHQRNWQTVKDKAYESVKGKQAHTWH